MGHHIVRRPKASPDQYYIDPQQLRSAIIEMQSMADGMTEEFAKMLMKIQEKVLEFPRFAGYPDDVKDEMRSENLMRWVKRGWRTINPDKNPFSYITTACSLNFLTALEKYFKRQNREEELKQTMIEFRDLYLTQETEQELNEDNDHE